MKKASSSNTVSSIVVAAPRSSMVFPYNETVPSSTQNPKRVKIATKKKGPPPTTSTSRYDLSLFQILSLTTPMISFSCFHTGSRTRSDDPSPLPIEHHPHVHEDIAVSPSKKEVIMKKCTPSGLQLQLKWPTHPAQLLILEARRNSNLNKLWRKYYF